MRIASTRGEVDAIVAHLAGSYPPSAKERRGAVAKAVLFASIGPLLAYVGWIEDPAGFREAWWAVALFLAGGPLIGLSVLVHDTASWTVDATSFARRNIVPLGNWTIPLSDIRSVDLDLGWRSFELTTTSDRRRKFMLRPAAQEKLETVPRPTEPQGFDVTGEGRSLLWYSTVILVLSIAAIALDVTVDSERLHWLPGIALALASPLAIAGILFAPAGIIWSLALRGAARDPDAPQRYRRILYGVLLAVVIGVAAMMVVLARKGLVTW